MALNSGKNLTIDDLFVVAGKKEIVRGVSLKICPSELHVVMGPNGSGKSTLTHALMGNPVYQVSQGTVKIGNKSILNLTPEERARMGIMLAFQSPIVIPGVTMSNFLRTAYFEVYGDKNVSLTNLHKIMQKHAEYLNFPVEFLRRSINEDFSGGERKKAEMLQLLVLKPKFAMFDEIDTGLDVDALKTVAHGIAQLQKQGSGTLIITHYQRILKYLKPTKVHIMKQGQIVTRGDAGLIRVIEEKGYAAV